MDSLHLPDEELFRLLDDSNAELPEQVAEHISRCLFCQQRIEIYAAEAEVWQAAKVGLANNPNSIFKSSIRRLSIGSTVTAPMAQQLLEPPTHPEMLGRLGRYEVERVIGSGGMGIVFKAHDTELHRPVAIKILAPHLSESGSARARFEREARATAAIVHDHVIPIYNVESDHSTPYFVMQYIAGETLQARIDRVGPIELVEILRIGMQVAMGLAAAHAQGLIHRDVKPSNILLNENVSRALLTDFGLARTQCDAGLTHSGFHPGTPHYMSPEQVQGKILDGRSDLFSLGCVLYAMCTGHPPFQAESGFAVMRRITDDHPSSILDQNPSIPKWFEQIVLCLLEKEREKRIPSAQCVSAVFEQCLGHVQRPSLVELPELEWLPARKRKPGWLLKKKWWIAASLCVLASFSWVPIVVQSSHRPNNGPETLSIDFRNVSSDAIVDFVPATYPGDESTITSDGLRVLQAADNREIDLPPREIGVKTLVSGAGDFTAELDWTANKIQAPTDGWGQGVLFTVELDDQAITELQLALIAYPNKGTNVRVKKQGNRVSKTSTEIFHVDFTSGVFVIERRGNEAIFSVKQDGKSKILTRFECPTEDLRYASIWCTRQAKGNTSSDYLFRSLRITADSFFSYQTSRESRWAWWHSALVGQTLVLGCLFLSTRMRSKISGATNER